MPKKQPKQHSPRQLAVQFNFAHAARIKGHCSDLANIAREFERPDIKQEIRIIELALQVELEAQCARIRNKPPVSGKKGGEPRDAT